MGEERLVFSVSVEGLFVRALDGKLTPQLKQALVAIGFDLDKRLLPAYPADKFDEAIALCASTLYPELPMEKAQWELGAATVSGWTRTLLGKAMAEFSRVIGPRRMVLRLPTSVKSSNNYSRVSVRELGPTEFELTIAPHVGLPEYMQGSLHAVIEMTGGKNPHVEITSRPKHSEDVVFRIRWEA